MKEELKKATDYSEGQKTAAYMVLGEIVNLLNEFSDNIRIIGGWVPTLLYPTGDHIGSIDRCSAESTGDQKGRKLSDD